MGHQSTGSWSVFPALQDSGSWVPIFREKYMIYVHIWKTHEFNPGIFHDIPCRLDYFTWSLRPTNSLRSLTDSSLRDEESATAIPRCFFVAAALAQKKRCCLSRLAGVCGQTSVDSFNPSVVTLQLDELLFAYLYQFFFAFTQRLNGQMLLFLKISACFSNLSAVMKLCSWFQLSDLLKTAIGIVDLPNVLMVIYPMFFVCLPETTLACTPSGTNRDAPRFRWSLINSRSSSDCKVFAHGPVLACRKRLSCWWQMVRFFSISESS